MTDALVTEKFPGWREAARRFMAGGEGHYISDVELAEIFREEVGTDEWRMQRLKLGIHLRRSGGHGLIRDHATKGYRLANDAEKVEVLAVRELKGAASALVRQHTYLANVDVAALSSEQSRKRDHMLTSGGAIATLIGQAQFALSAGPNDDDEATED